MLNLKSRLFLCALVLISGLISSANAQSEDSAVSQLVAILEQSGSMQAEVEQLVLDQNGRELQQSLARLKMQKPDHFSWELIEPYEELMVTNGEKIWRYEPDLEQVTIQTFDNDLSRTPVLLLNGDAESLQNSYAISMRQLPDSAQQFQLLPLSSGALFERLSLTFDDNVLQEMQFEDSLGQKTSLYFSSLESNVTFANSVFEFSIPPGIEVVDTTQD